VSSGLRVVVIGYGVQGHKRAIIAGSDVIAVVDPISTDAGARSLSDVPPDSYDAALVCTPDHAKFALLDDLLSRGKHVLVEKPLVGSDAQLAALAQRAEQNGAVCYTAYNHRFEPHFVRMRDALASGAIGIVYHCRLFYGNGTARLVRDSAWRDSGSGALHDLGSHLLDTLLFWFGDVRWEFRIVSSQCFENRAPDHIVFAAAGMPQIECEMTLLSWRNHFTCDIFGSEGSLHISSLCKWGPSSFTLRRRVLPSGRPPEETVTLVQDDPTWAAEYDHFRNLCVTRRGGDLARDRRLNAALSNLARQAGDVE
jgi:scyllo-inositol 2-dehydrogenase (NADP+)